MGSGFQNQRIQMVGRQLNLTAQTFKRLRILAGHKQASLAEALGCSVTTISNFERGLTKRLYSVDYKRLAQELNLTNSH